MINGRGSNRDGSNVRVSSIEDHTTAQALRIVAMSLPFNLLNMEPLQFIKVAAIPYPFVFNREKRKESKPESENGEKREEEGRGFMVEEYKEVKTFHLSGVKLGRNQENDFRYPDELSISGRHVQIIFKNDSYYIRDLGSKTGTFMYVSHERPLVLVDDQSIQLSN